MSTICMTCAITTTLMASLYNKPIDKSNFFLIFLLFSLIFVNFSLKTIYKQELLLNNSIECQIFKIFLMIPNRWINLLNAYTINAFNFDFKVSHIVLLSFRNEWVREVHVGYFSTLSIIDALNVHFYEVQDQEVGEFIQLID